MLDLRTIIVIITLLLIAQAAGLLLIWRLLPRMPGLRELALGLCLVAASMVLLSLRGSAPAFLTVTVSNIATHAGTALYIVGLALLAGRPIPYVVAGVATAVAVVYWPVVMWLDPANIQQRIVVSSFLTALEHGTAALIILRAELLPRVLRWPLVILHAEHSGLALLRGADALLQPQMPADLMAASSGLQVVFFAETVVYALFSFVGVAAMIAARLTFDVAAKNRSLEGEVVMRRKLQEELSVALAHESTLRREQRHFLDMVSHDFRTPLAIIDRAAEMIGVMQGAALPTGVAQRLGAIRDAVRRLRLMIDTLLTDERLESGAGAMRKAPVPMLDLLDELRHGLVFTGSDQRLVIDTDAARPVCFGDADMLRMVFANLIDNALKYSPADAAVTVTLRQEGGEAVVTVRDRGIGIPESELAAVGTRFFRATNAKAAPGTGLGLFAASRLIQFHGGRFAIRSKQGEGTTVEIRLPLAEVAAIPAKTA